MKFYLVSGKVRFLTHKVEYECNGEIIAQEFYDAKKKDAYINGLTERKIEYTATEIEQPLQEIRDKVQGKKFNTIAEAQAFIEGNNIEMLKAELAETDYRIIKSYEYQLVCLPLPYDIEQLHTERQAIRDRINQLEGEAL